VIDDLVRSNVIIILPDYRGIKTPTCEDEEIRREMERIAKEIKSILKDALEKEVHLNQTYQ